MLNLAEVRPAGIVTPEGTTAEGLELLNATNSPPAGAAALMVTVLIVVVIPPWTVVGERTREDTSSGVTVSTPDFVAPPADAEIVAAVDVETCAVTIVNFTDVAPCGTVTVAGTDADGSELASETAKPPTGAAALIVR